MTAYMTSVEVAEKIRVPLGTVRYWRHIGYGPRSFKVGRHVIYDAKDVDRWLREARQSDGDIRDSNRRRD